MTKPLTIKPNLNNLPDIEFYQVEKWDCENIWETKEKLFAVKQGQDVIIMDLKSMQNLARQFDKTLTKIIGSEVNAECEKLINQYSKANNKKEASIT